MKDDQLRRMAKNRVEFRDHLYIFLVINGFLAAMNLWWTPSFLWSLFVTFFWGIGLFFHYREAYYGTSDVAVEKEYQKLKKAYRKK